MTKHPFALEEQDRNSPTWARLMDHFEERLRRLRIDNDAPMDPEATAGIRGQIKAYKAMLNLNTKPKAMPSD